MKSSVLLNFLLLVVLCAGAGCQPSSEGQAECRPRAAQLLCDRGDEYACRWAALVESNVDADSMAPLVGLAPGATRDEILVALLPDLDGVTISDGAPTDATEVTLHVTDSFTPVTVALPLDWTMSPYQEPSWELFFHGLYWFDKIPPSVAGQILIHWIDNVLLSPTPPDVVWGDHCTSLRISHVSKMVAAYIASGGPVQREVLWAAARLITTHLYALATTACYAPAHNHGVMQDRAILRALVKYPLLADSEALWSFVGDRLTAQVEWSVTPEGVHTENSPGYHLFFMHLLHEIGQIFAQGGRAAPAGFAGVRSLMSSALIYLLQPNLTFPQFGDTQNDDHTQELLDTVTRYRESGATDDGLSHLQWVASRGQSGQQPPELDRVWPQSGYAAFRSSWTAHDAAITGHFTCGKLSNVHYNRDETSIAVYGYGQELIVDPGLLSFRKDDLTLYSRSGRAHNTLIVDNTEHAADGAVAITDWGGEDTDLAWVSGGHSHYADLGVRSLARTFAHAKPDIFLVVDHLQADTPHSLEQHFLLHPSLSVVTQPAPHVIVATGDATTSPSIVLSALPGVTIEIHRGVSEGEEITGWYFPEFNVIEEATELVFHQSFGGGLAALPILIHVVAPGESVDSELESFDSTAGELHLGWTTSEGAGGAVIPAPPL